MIVCYGSNVTLCAVLKLSTCGLNWITCDLYLNILYLGRIYAHCVFFDVFVLVFNQSCVIQ